MAVQSWKNVFAKIPKQVWALIILIILASLSFFIPMLLILGNAEITNPDVALQVSYYPAFLIFGIVVVLLLYYTSKLWNGDNKYGGGFGFFNIGEYPAFEWTKKLTAMQWTLISTIVFGILFLVANSLKALGVGFTGSKFLPLAQQFSPGQALSFSTLFIPGPEEIFMLAIMGIFVFTLTLFAIRYAWSKTEYRIYYFILVPLAVGFVAMILHSTVYSSSSVAITTVFAFWTIKAFLDLAVGFFVIGWIMHGLNNFFLDYPRIFSSGALYGFMIVLILVLMAIYWYFYIYKKSKVA